MLYSFCIERNMSITCKFQIILPVIWTGQIHTSFLIKNQNVVRSHYNCLQSKGYKNTHTDTTMISIFTSNQVLQAPHMKSARGRERVQEVSSLIVFVFD